MKQQVEREFIRQWKAGPEHRRALLAAAVCCLTEHTEEAPKLRARFPREAFAAALQTVKAQKDAEMWLPVAEFIEHDILEVEQ